MKKLILLILLSLINYNIKAGDFVSGADVSWCTEMEADGIKFYNYSAEETDIFLLMKEIGMEAIRLRVWFDPGAYGYGNWCDKADVVTKAKRAHEQGLDLMIDFHYSDFFTDPGRQNAPQAWKNMTMDEVKNAMASHTVDVLQALKNEGIAPKWVQVGNETNSGIVSPFGDIDWDKTGTNRFANYTILNNVGYDAVKSVFPDAQVIVHIGGAANVQWIFPDFKASGGKFDIIGLSHYPTESEWDSDDASATASNINVEKYVIDAIEKFDVPVIICETGFDGTKPGLAHEVMIDLFNRMRAIPQCKGIFYWEPQVNGIWKPDYYEKLGWNAYGMGAFSTDYIPTKALDAFGGRTVVNKYPSALKIYDKSGQNALATLQPVVDNDGVYSTQINVTEAWLNFHVVDEENNIWYGSDPSDKTKLSSESGKWNLWIDSDRTGIYDVTVNLVDMKWTHSFNEEASSDVDTVRVNDNEFTKWYDLYGNQIKSPVIGGVYILKKGTQVYKRYYK